MTLHYRPQSTRAADSRQLILSVVGAMFARKLRTERVVTLRPAKPKVLQSFEYDCAATGRTFTINFTDAEPLAMTTMDVQARQELAAHCLGAVNGPTAAEIRALVVERYNLLTAGDVEPARDAEPADKALAA